MEQFRAGAPGGGGAVPNADSPTLLREIASIMRCVHSGRTGRVAVLELVEWQAAPQVVLMPMDVAARQAREEKSCTS